MSGQETDVQFDALLQPYRSLSRNGFILLMAVAGILMALIGISFLIQGAWVVLGFGVLELGLLYGAFKLSFASGRRWERLTLTDKVLRVTRGTAAREAGRWEFQPQWLRVLIEKRHGQHAEIKLSSHGQDMTVGHLLPPDERVEVAEALRSALSRWRTPHHLRT